MFIWYWMFMNLQTAHAIELSVQFSNTIEWMTDYFISSNYLLEKVDVQKDVWKYVHRNVQKDVQNNVQIDI